MPGEARGVLTVAAAPARDPADASARLGPALASATLVVADDPARLGRLAGALGVALTARVVTCAGEADGRGGLRADRAAEPVSALVATLLAGQDVLVVTDAGQPGGVAVAADALVAAAADAGIRVTVLPGPSEIVTALVVAGLPGDRFVVEGFPSAIYNGRERPIAELAAERRTLIFSGSPPDLGRTLAELAAALGADRRAAACRGLPGGHNDVVRGRLGELAEFAGQVAGARQAAGAGPAGQVTLVVAGAGGPAPESVATLADAVAQVRARVGDGATTRDAVAAVAAATGVRRRDLYNAATESARTAEST